MKQRYSGKFGVSEFLSLRGVSELLWLRVIHGLMQCMQSRAYEEVSEIIPCPRRRTTITIE